MTSKRLRLSGFSKEPVVQEYSSEKQVPTL